MKGADIRGPVVNTNYFKVRILGFLKDAGEARLKQVGRILRGNDDRHFGVAFQRRRNNLDTVRRLREEGLHLKEIAKRLAKESGWSARDIYRLGLE
jgi:hypothetical protein